MTQLDLEKIDLEQLRQTLDFLSKSMSGYMSDCAIVSLHKQNHPNSVALKVETNSKDYLFCLTWQTEINRHLLSSSEDKERTTEWGAMGIALLLAKRLTEFPYIRTSPKGTGIDFYLSRTDEELTFDARLEVRGIARANSSNNLTTALGKKKKQTEKSDNTRTPVYIAITEFSEPKSLFFQK